MTSSMQLTPFQ